jgi:hypothetical protein
MFCRIFPLRPLLGACLALASSSLLVEGLAFVMPSGGDVLLRFVTTDLATKMTHSLTANYSKYVTNRSKTSPPDGMTNASPSTSSDDDANAKQAPRRGLSGKILQNINKLSVKKRSHHSGTASPAFVTPLATPMDSPWQTPRNPVSDPQVESKNVGNGPVEVPNPMKNLGPEPSS